MTDDFDIVQYQADLRQSRIAGLRQLADFLDQHPDLPVPYVGNANAFVDSRTDLARIARVAGVKWQKGGATDYFFLRVAFDGDVAYDVNVSREQVCRKVVTGTRIEPAQPAREVEEFHWVCDEPLLAGAQ